MVKLSQNADLIADFYFDVFPVHPQPEHLESLTSYLTRLAETNGISSMDGLSALCFPGQDRRITRDIADYAPVSFYKLPVVGVCTEEKLRATTFFHVAAKFGRSTSPQPLSRFLSGCISQYLRYCPACLAEQENPYYQLSWRFLSVSCCTKHNCRILEKCQLCSNSIPLFTSPFKMGICPFCNWSLKNGQINLVAKEEKEKVYTSMSDIEFLLTSQPWEKDCEDVIKSVGRGLVYERRRRNISAEKLAEQVGSTLTVIQGIENGSFMRKGATLQSYIKYTRFLCLSLKDVFHYVLSERKKGILVPVLRPLCPICRLNCYIIRDGYNRRGLQRYQCQNCSRSFTL
jgi:ribosome-binding protein aMBF1 (putative translation factor)